LVDKRDNYYEDEFEYEEFEEELEEEFWGEEEEDLLKGIPESERDYNFDVEQRKLLIEVVQQLNDFQRAKLELCLPFFRLVKKLEQESCKQNSAKGLELGKKIRTCLWWFIFGNRQSAENFMKEVRDRWALTHYGRTWDEICSS